MGLRAGLNVCRKSRPPPGFDPWSVQPVTSRYTDYAIPVHVVYNFDVFSSNCVILDMLSRGMYIVSCECKLSFCAIVMFVQFLNAFHYKCTSEGP
jgi:hypothetical protein